MRVRTWVRLPAPAIVVAIAIVTAGTSPAFADPTCGNGTREEPEQCDDGPANGTPGSDCTVVCQEVIPALRIPGGGLKKRDCQLEGVLDLASPARDRQGIPLRVQSCLDGDPSCDRDPAVGMCRFAFWICVAGADPRIGCAADHVASLSIRKPTVKDVGSLGVARAELHDKLGAYLATGPGEICSGRMILPVPAGKRLRVHLRTRNAASRLDVDGFVLRCLPR